VAAISDNRLVSLDVFRGLAVAGMILVDNQGDDDNAYWPLRHAEWNGWTAADLVFPSFLFLVGAALVLAFSARLRRGESRRRVLLHALRRSLLLFLLGLFLNGFPLFRLADWRIEGVLQRIALCYFFSSILVLWVDWRGQLAAVGLCLLGYWALVHFVPVPGFGVPGRDVPFLDPERNVVAWLDRTLFAGRLYDGNRDPEGVLSTIPAIATCLAGALAGRWLASPRPLRDKAAAMGVSGAVCFAVGLVWGHWFPVNKNLWTSSFVLLTAGFDLVLLAALHWVVDVRRLRGEERNRWTIPFLVFGMNPIAGFVGDSFVYGTAEALGARESLTASFRRLLGDPAVASLMYSLCAVAFAWALLWVLWRKRIFLKI
jgi:predicted acyltransferase